MCLLSSKVVIALIYLLLTHLSWVQIQGAFHKQSQTHAEQLYSTFIARNRNLQNDYLGKTAK